MSTSFADLKRSRKTSLTSLVEASQKISEGTQQNSFKDDRFWQPQVDKAGNGYAVIRFLPAPTGEDFPWVRVFTHGFQGPTGRWYIENSLTTLNKKDPVSEYNNVLWNRGDDAGKDLARKQKRRLTYISNILVIKDSSNPANEGQVFLYRYGKKIFDKINDLMNPSFEDESPVNPFDFWEGADFKLKIRQVEGFRNYDKSEFDSSSELHAGEDEKLQETWTKQYSLQEFLSASNFKTYDELKDKLNMVLGLDGSGAQPSTTAEDYVAAPAPTPPVVEAPEPVAEEIPQAATSEDEDEDLSFFQKLADED